MGRTKNMKQFSIILQIEGGGQIEIPCKDAEDYARKSKTCETVLPDKEWKEIGIKKNGQLMSKRQLWRSKNPKYEQENTSRRKKKTLIKKTEDFLKTLNDRPSLGTDSQ